MIKAILFDLDDTLLGNNVDIFLPKYFSRLGRYVAPVMPKDDFIPLLLACTQETIKDQDLAMTNRDVFWRAFVRESGLDEQEMVTFLDRFYETEFPALREFTEPRPCAPDLVQYCLELGLKVVVATNPLFPPDAIAQRLAWAGLPPSEFDFSLVTTMDNMHATKPNITYYQEILEMIDCSPHEAVMVGDSWANDIQPAATLGMARFWIPPDETPAADPAILQGSGTLADFYGRVQDGWLHEVTKRAS